MTKAAIYCRVSTEDQAERYGLGAQQAACASFIEQAGWELTRVYADAITGQTEDRPQLNQALADARGGAFEHIVLYDHTRLGRKRKISASIRDDFQGAGVNLSYVASGGTYDADSEGAIILDSVQDAMSEIEVRKLVRRSKAGKRQAVEEVGAVILSASVPYGYRKVLEVTEGANGKQKIYKSLEIEPAEADIVEWLYTEYAKGEATCELARQLNQRGVPKRQHPGSVGEPKPWVAINIRNLIRSRTYKGEWCFGMTRIVGDKQRVRVPEDEWLVAPVPRIVSDDLWDAANKVASCNKERSRRNMKHEYLLRLRIRCEDCNTPFVGRTQTVKLKQEKQQYGYYNHRFPSKCPNSHESIKQSEIEAMVTYWLLDLVSHPEQIAKRVAEMAQEDTVDVSAAQADLKAAKKSLVTQQAKAARLLDLYIDGKLPKSELESRRAQLDAGIAHLTDRVAELEAAVHPPDQHPPEYYEAILTQYYERLRGATDDASWLRRIDEDPESYLDWLNDEVSLAHEIAYLIEALDVRVATRWSGDRRELTVSCAIAEHSLSTVDAPC
jgi:site-specific DNA recombinase